MTISTIRRRRIEADARMALDAVAASVAEQRAVGQDLDRLHLAERDSVVVRVVAAHLEHVAEVGAKGESDRELDRVRVVVEQPEPLVQAVVVQEPIAADADRARLGHDFAAVGTDQRVVGELQVAHEVELARCGQQGQPRARDVQLEQAQVPRVAVVQAVAFEVEGLDVAGAVGDEEDLTFFENGPLEHGPRLGRSHVSL